MSTRAVEAAAVWAGLALTASAFFAFFVIMPALAPALAALGASPALLGLGVGLYSAGNLLGNVAGGLVLDRRGPRAPVVLGLLLTALILLGHGLTASLVAFMVLRFLHGLFAGVLPPGAFVGLGVGERRLPFNLAGGLIALTALVAPPLGGVLRDRLGVQAPFLVAGAALLLALPLALGMPRRSEGCPAGFPVWRSLLPVYAAVLGVSFALGVVLAFVPGKLAWSGAAGRLTGLAFAFFSAGAMAAMAAEGTGLWRWRRTPSAGLLLSGAALLGLGFGTSVGNVWAGMAVFGLGFGLVFPGTARAVAQKVEESTRGRAYGLFYAAFSLGAFLGPALGGALSSLGAWAPFSLAGAVLLAGVGAQAGSGPERKKDDLGSRGV